MPKIKPYTHLLNGCYRTEIAVSPANWKTKQASTKKNWLIWYRFHDPSQRTTYPKGRLVKDEKMNRFTDLSQRQAYTQELLNIHTDLIDIQHYNPITEVSMIPYTDETNDMLVDPQTPFIVALEKGLELKEMDPESKKDIKNKLPHVKKAAESLKVNGKPMTAMPICQIRRKHMRLVLNRIGRDKGAKWTANNFNRYRTDLHIVFTELNELEAMDVNPMDGIKKRKHAREPRETLTPEQLVKVDEFLRKHYPTFWRFLKIFFASGCRITEMLRVQLEDVDLGEKKFKVLIKKGDDYRWVWKVIDEDVLPLWKEIIEIADSLEAPVLVQAANHSNDNKDDEPKLYLFAEDLSPEYRKKPIRSEQITRRWRNHIKEKLGITADFYSLKHMRTTSDIDLMVEAAIAEAQKKAAEKNGHTTTKMVQGVYDVKSEERKQAIIRKIKSA